MMLQVEAIHTYYGLVHMLHGVSLNVAEGEFVGLLGRNGAGKSTTIKSIMGLVPPRSGRVLFKDEEITGQAPYMIAQRGIAYVPGTRGIFSELTTLENLNMVRNRQSRWTLEDVLARFPKLEELKNRRGRYLSGGEQQILAIGRALVTGPELLLFDEPSQGLAPMVVESVINMLQELKREQVSMLLVEQNVEMALELVDRVLILDQGRLVFEGSPDELRQNTEVQTAYLGLGY
ncbi:MAG: ABC transporter ATP-binding protein [Candidatus Tectomicrobia bacterium]